MERMHRFHEDPDIAKWWKGLNRKEKELVYEWIDKTENDGQVPDDWEWDMISYAYTEMPVGLFTKKPGRFF